MVFPYLKKMYLFLSHQRVSLDVCVCVCVGVPDRRPLQRDGNAAAPAIRSAGRSHSRKRCHEYCQKGQQARCPLETQFIVHWTRP